VLSLAAAIAVVSASDVAKSCVLSPLSHIKNISDRLFLEEEMGRGEQFFINNFLLANWHEEWVSGTTKCLEIMFF